MPRSKFPKQEELPSRKNLLKAYNAEAAGLQKIYMQTGKQLSRLQLEAQMLKQMLATTRMALPPDSEVLQGEPESLRAQLEGVEPFKEAVNGATEPIPSTSGQAAQALLQERNRLGRNQQQEFGQKRRREKMTGNQDASLSQKSKTAAARGRGPAAATRAAPRRPGKSRKYADDEEEDWDPDDAEAEVLSEPDTSDEDWQDVHPAFAAADELNPLGVLTFSGLLAESMNAGNDVDDDARESEEEGAEGEEHTEHRKVTFAKNASPMGKPPLPPRAKGVQGKAQTLTKQNNGAERADAAAGILKGKRQDTYARAAEQAPNVAVEAEEIDDESGPDYEPEAPWQT